jgi:hypothetical protein
MEEDRHPGRRFREEDDDQDEADQDAGNERRGEFENLAEARLDRARKE